MKKIILAAGILASTLSTAASFSINSNSGNLSAIDTGYVPSAILATYTQNTDPATIIPSNSASCNGGGLHTDNSYFRRFDLDGDHGVNVAINVDSVDIGLEQVTGAGGTQPVVVNLYSIANADALDFANMTMIGTLATNQADANAVIQNYVVTGIVNGATDDLVVELFTPDGQAAGHSFFIGSNDLGQIAPSYLMAATCGIAVPTDTANIGFPNMHIVMTVNATNVAPPAPIPALNWLGLVFMVMLLAMFSRKLLKS